MNANNKGPRILIIGAGISGICLAIRLRRAGIKSFEILEKSNDVGGTWLDNTYPGCACDIPATLYSYSFAPKHNWSRRYPPQAEILEYFRDCADRFKVRSHIRFGQSVESARFDEKESVWRVRTGQDEELVADVLISAVGQLSRPKIPEITGLDSFQGEFFHTARWNHDFDVSGRDIAVVGNGASAIQVIPKIALKAKKVFVFQRSPNWISRRHDYAYPRLVQHAFRWVPGVAKLYRWWTYLTHEWRINLYRRRATLNKGFTNWLLRSMRSKLREDLQEAVIPKYPAGCKRVLLSNDYLEALNRDNVKLISSEIRRIEPKGIETDSGLTTVDAIVFATGFDANQFLYPMQVVGRGGVKLHDLWSERPKTYLGMLCEGFPNFFMLYGPNTNLGHNSIIFMVECQVNYILRCLNTMQKNGSKTIEIRGSAVDQFDQKLQEQLRQKVWNGYVTNWYRNDAGFIVNNWCRSTTAYWLQTRKPNHEVFQFDNGK